MRIKKMAAIFFLLTLAGCFYSDTTVIIHNTTNEILTAVKCEYKGGSFEIESMAAGGREKKKIEFSEKSNLSLTYSYGLNSQINHVMDESFDPGFKGEIEIQVVNENTIKLDVRGGLLYKLKNLF